MAILLYHQLRLTTLNGPGFVFHAGLDLLCRGEYTKKLFLVQIKQPDRDPFFEVVLVGFEMDSCSLFQV